jgi:hypothetical protein
MIFINYVEPSKILSQHASCTSSSVFFNCANVRIDYFCVFKYSRFLLVGVCIIGPFAHGNNSLSFLSLKHETVACEIGNLIFT